MVSVGNVPSLGTKWYPLALFAFKKFLVSTLNNKSVVLNFGIFRGSFAHFYTLTWFSRHYMCIIQIWTTRTCSGAYKLVEKSNMCHWLHAYVPCKKWEWMSKTLPPSLGRKHWDTWFINSSKSKTRLKFMKLGMLSWSGINMPWYNFRPNLGKFGSKLLTNQSFSQQAWWFR